jgi:PhnB protein
MKPFKPGGYTSVSPYFVVKGAQQLVNLIITIFEAQQLRRYDAANGTIMHVELKIDDSVIMISDSSENYPPNNLLVHIYVPSVDDVFKKAISAGCESIEVPTQREGDPDKRGMFKDFAGNVWAVGTQLS